MRAIRLHGDPENRRSFIITATGSGLRASASTARMLRATQRSLDQVTEEIGLGATSCSSAPLLARPSDCHYCRDQSCDEWRHIQLQRKSRRLSVLKSGSDRLGFGTTTLLSDNHSSGN